MPLESVTVVATTAPLLPNSLIGTPAKFTSPTPSLSLSTFTFPEIDPSKAGGIADTLGVLLGSPLGRALVLGVSLRGVVKDGEEDGAIEVVGAELIDGAEVSLSSTETETGSIKAMVGESDGAPERAVLIDGEDDGAVGLIEGPAPRDGKEEGLEDGIAETVG